jgi:hypothetical protein
MEGSKMKNIWSVGAGAALVLLTGAAPMQAQRGHGDKQDDHKGPPPQAQQHQEQHQEQHQAPQRHAEPRHPEPQQHARTVNPVHTAQQQPVRTVNPVHAQVQQQQQQQARPVNPLHSAPQQQVSHVNPLHPVDPAQQRQRISDQREWNTRYQHNLDANMLRLQDQSLRLQQQRRMRQYAVQQQYLANLRAEQAQARAYNNYDRDPYYSSPNIYRYNRGGTYYQTNQYGASVLQRAVNYGYQEGVRSGQADRQDNWAPNYQNSYAYQDANYGYDGLYVNQADYNYYFRQGFQRGYQDGYGGRLQYGSATNGSYSILGSLLSSILGFQSIQ